jgi:endonuclease/exonuclease/phosphatase family metal-dependent hydrolase
VPQFRIVTWNVENFFPPGTAYGPKTQALYDGKVANLAGVIKDLTPDVIALQEVGADSALADLQQALGEGYQGAAHAHRGTPDGRGIAVALLARHALGDVSEVSLFPAGSITSVVTEPAEGDPITKMSRGAVCASVNVGGKKIRVLAAHLKSKLLTYPGAGGNARFSPHDEDERARVAAIALFRRASEATALRAKANSLVVGDAHALVLLGDLNDEASAATTQILRGPSGSELGTAGAARPDKGDDARLWNLAPLLPEGRDYSRIQDGRRELIDHIFVSQELLALGGAMSIVSGDPAVDSKVDFRESLPSITDDPGPRREDVWPDHAPVVATFNLK